MNKKLALAVFILTATLMPAAWAADNVIISEVLYDPLVTETGGEAVEIYNPTGSAVDISGWAIRTESSSSDATIPDGTLLEAHSYYLVADAGWSSAKDNASWPEADHEEAITMSNTDAGVALVAANGTIIDALGWGDIAGIADGLYEGTPAMPVSAGNSLKRTDLDADSDDNSVDFSETIPELQNSSSAAAGPDNEPGTSIEIGVDVENNAPTILSVSVLEDEDTETPGIQVMPVPEGTKEVVLSATVTDVDGTEPAVSAIVTGPDSETTMTMTKVEDINSTTARYNATLLMQFYNTAGTYTASVLADDGSGNSTAETSFEYLRMAAISIDATSLLFTGAHPGGTTTISGDYALSTADTPTVRNTGNTPLDIGLYGTDFTDGEKSIGISNLKYSFDNDFDGALAGTISTAMQIHSLGLVNSEDSVQSLGFQLAIPAGTQNGNYTTEITIVAVSSE